MATVEPAKNTIFRNIFLTAADNINEVISKNIAAAANGHWERWSTFCREVELNPPLVAYRDPFLIVNAFARQYRTGYITPIIRQVKSRTVEDAIRSIGQVLTDLGTRDPCLTSQE